MKAFLEEMAQPYLIRIIEEDKGTIQTKLAEIWNSKKDSIMMDGFRKGKVPQDVAEKKYGFENLYRPYIDELLHTAIDNVNSENNVTIMDLQQVYPEKLSKDGIVMQAVAYLKPSVTELDYSNVEVTKLDNNPTEDEINAQIEALRQQQALIVPITDRPVQFGDIVVVSYIGYLDGTPFQGGQASKQQLTLVEKSFIPGFGEQIVGMTPNETKNFEVTFPENYHAENLKGKTTTFDLTLHEIKVKDLPELDDEFAITNGSDTFANFKTSLVEGLVQKKAQFNQSKTETEICLELVKRVKVSPIPQAMIQKRLDTLLQQEAHNVSLSAEDYLTQRKITKEVFDRTYYQVALRDLKVQLILDYVATQENLVVSEEERSDYLTAEADRLGYSLEQIKNMASVDQIDAQVRLRKAYDYLLANATYVEAKVGQEKA